MSQQIHITGMGIISSLGIGAAQTLESLRNSRTGIGRINFLPTRHKNDFVAGEIKHSGKELSEMAGQQDLNRTTLMALIAAREALSSAGITNTKDFRTGLISSTTVAGMTDTELLYPDFMKGVSSRNFIDEHFSGAGTNHLAHILGITELVTTLSTACSSAANAIMLGARMIRNGLLDRCIVGGSDALSLFTFNGFNTLMILDKEWCRPFDENRRGLNLGEGAAYLVIESEKCAGSRSKAILSGYSNTNDAYHQTASSPEGRGAVLAMQQALQAADLSAEQIDYVNAHGTGTPNNDSSEGLAMEKVFSEEVPPFSSTKSYTGHTLAAAASVEAVISLLSLRENLIFPTLNYSTPMKELQNQPVSQMKSVQMKHIMSNSFGFGGNCSSLIFSRN